MIRTFYVWLHLLIATLACGGTVIALALVRYRGRLYYRVSRAWCRWMLWASGTTVYVEGMERADEHRPQIFVSNHQSWFDVWALGVATRKHFRFVAKKELERIPVFGRAWRAAEHISIDRSDRASAIRSLEVAERLLRSDDSAVIIFAEGTRSRTGALQPFKKGAFMLAISSGVEVVPTAVVGSREVMGKGDWRVHPGPIIVRFGEPMDPGAYGNGRRDELVEDARERVRMLMEAGDVVPAPTIEG